MIGQLKNSPFRLVALGNPADIFFRPKNSFIELPLIYKKKAPIGQLENSTKYFYFQPNKLFQLPPTYKNKCAPLCWTCSIYSTRSAFVHMFLSVIEIKNILLKSYLYFKNRDASWFLFKKKSSLYSKKNSQTLNHIFR